MTPELKAQWVAALRSGEFKQAKGVMMDKDGGMCCLAVLREIVAPGDRETSGNANMMPTETFARGIGHPLYTRSGDSIALARWSEMNDKGHSFAEIATDIEATL